MDKQAINIDPATVGRYALGGALTGGSAAAITNLLRMVNQMKADRERKLAPTETDEGTIVLTLPNKGAAVVGDKDSEPIAVKKHADPSQVMTVASKSQMRRYDGTFGQKLAAGGWPTMTASGLAALGGGAAGAHIVNKVYEQRRERQLQAELDAARQEYMDLLEGGAKGAEWVNAMVPDVSSEFEKMGQSSTFGYLDYPLAFGALLTILGSGGSAYLTKRILDEKMEEGKANMPELPSVKRVVFRSSPSQVQTDEEEKEGAETMACAQAALGVMLDKVGDSTIVLEEPGVKAAMVEAKTTAATLMKMADEVSELMAYFQQNPQLRQMIQRAAMSKHKVLGKFPGFMRNMALKIPAFQDKADSMLYSRMNQAFDPRQSGTPSPLTKPAADKSGNVGSNILSSLMGSTLAENDPQVLAQAIVAEQEKARMAREQPEEAPRSIQLGAEGLAANKYLEVNKNRIMSILQQMAAKGNV